MQSASIVRKKENLACMVQASVRAAAELLGRLSHQLAKAKILPWHQQQAYAMPT
jgi:hypothetical protein